MQMICAESSCSNSISISTYENPVSLVCPKCGSLRVSFEVNVQILEPSNKSIIGNLQAGKVISADDLRDVRVSPWRRAFIVQPLPLQKTDIEPRRPIEPLSMLEAEDDKTVIEQPTGIDAIPKPKPVVTKHKKRRGRPRKEMRPVT